MWLPKAETRVNVIWRAFWVANFQPVTKKEMYVGTHPFLKGLCIQKKICENLCDVKNYFGKDKVDDELALRACGNLTPINPTNFLFSYPSRAKYRLCPKCTDNGDFGKPF